MLNLPVFRKGKVRDVYSVDDDKLLLVATDRVSVFDHVLPTKITGKGNILTQISNFWFSKTTHICPNHLIATDIDEIINYLPSGTIADKEFYRKRTVLGHKAQRIDFECVVRGYVVGSGWKDYQQTGAICGIPLPAGLEQAQKLPEPIFTPAAKNDTGHDENVSFEVMQKALGPEQAQALKDISLALYNFAYEYLLPRGIILADTKFEFGILNGEIIVIDEMLTPDSSRFWEAALYKTGTNPQSYDKQFVRDFIEATGWDKNSAPPAMPKEIVDSAVKRYKQALDLILKK